jgi:hypothetical protein
MASQETGKDRAARIPKDYFKAVDPLEKGKRWLALGAVAVGLGWWATSLVPGVHGNRWYSRGPVAQVHATWDDTCSACHVPLTPIRGEKWAYPLTGDVRAAEARCQACHTGPPHHASQKAEDTPTCAACHREHRGREASLVRLSDHDCSACHADLAAHRVLEAPPLNFENVQRFDTEHPEFKVLRTGAPDPGKLVFNHARHLVRGMTLVEGGKPFTLGQIASADRERYRGAQDNKATDAPVVLICASCHQLEANPPARAGGAYQLPVTYEAHCRGCHPLTVDAAMPDALPVPHRIQPDKVRDFLHDVYAAEALKQDPALMARFVPPRPLVGRGRDEKAETVRTYIDEKVTRAQEVLYQGNGVCTKCHQYEPAKSPYPKRVLATAVKTVWFEHALFNHAAHHAVACKDCHKGAEKSTTAADVLLPGIATCRECHAPSRQTAEGVRGGARFDCTECHRYHQGDNPLVGLGAAERAAGQRLDIQEFLKGP